MSNYAEALNNSNNSKKKKNGTKIKKVFGGLVLTAVIGASIAGYAFRGDIVDFLKGFGKKNVDPDDLLAFSETIPLDRDGIIEITYPFVDRTFDEENGIYSILNSYDYVYVGDGESPTLNVVKNGELEPDNIVNFESTTGYPREIIGVRNDYAKFLVDAGEIKTTALSDSNSNNSKLVLEDYEVPNVYSLPAGFKLYCENEEINKQALLAYIAEDGTNVYVIPSDLIDEFVVVTEDEFTIIGKYNVFKERIAEVYVQYESNRLYNGTETTYSR